MQDPLGVPRRFGYDPMNRIVADSQGTVSFGTSHRINPLALCQTGYSPLRDLRCHHLVRRSASAYLKTAYWFGRSGLDSIVDPRFVKPRFQHDAQRRVRKEIDDYDLAKVMHYGRGGILDSITNRDSTVVRFAYDTIGRRTAMTYPAHQWDPSQGQYSVPGDTVTYAYDLLGRSDRRRRIAGSRFDEAISATGPSVTRSRH